MNNKEQKNISISIREIAKEADVSIATVSNVINKGYKVREKTRKKVEDVIKKHNYRINIGASSLRTKVSKLIGLIVPKISNPLFSNFYEKIEPYARELGYSIVICNNNYDYMQDVENIEFLASRNIDGLIIIPSVENIKVLKPAIKYDIPVVLVDRNIENSNCDIVTVDNYKAIYNVVNYLVSFGHKKILYINAEANYYHGQMKLKGFIDAMKNNGLFVNEDLIIRTKNCKYDEGYNLVKDIIRLKVKPSAIIAYNDMLAIGIMKGLNAAGFKIPEDYSLIGFDNIIIDNYLQTGLTSVAYDIDETAKNALQLLADRIKYKNNPQKILLIPATIIKSYSVSKPRK